MIRVRLEGMQEIEKQLEKLSVDLRENIITEGLLAGAEIVRQEATVQAPVGQRETRRKTRLKDTIVIEVGAKKQPSVRVGPNSDGFYGKFLETGTAERFTRKKAKSTQAPKSRGILPEQPFLEPALRTSKREAAKAAAEVIRRRLRDV